MAAGEELGLADFARILWHRKVSVVLLGILAAGAAFGFDTRRIKVYEGTAQLLITSPISSAISASGSNTAAPVDILTATKVITSPANEQAAAQLLRVPSLPGASASQSGGTAVVDVSVQSTDPALAVKAANAYAQAYINGQRTQAVASLEAAASQLSSKIADLGSQISAIQNQIDALTGSSRTAAANSSSVSALQAQQSSLVEQQTTLREQVTQLQDTAHLAGGGGQIIGPAMLPASLVSPHRTRDTALAGVVGLVLGIGFALLREYADDRIRSEADLEQALGSMPVLALIPTVPSWLPGRRSRHGGPHLIVDSTREAATASEAYRSLRTSIQFVGLDREIRTLVVTSPFSNEGKSTTVANLAAAMAQAGQTVVVLSCDLRKPQLHEAFGIPNDTGVTSVIIREVSAPDALQQVPGYESLFVMTSGPVPPNPSELLTSERTHRLLDALAERADIVLIDTPPLLPVTDAAVLAAHADATVMVIAAGQTTKKQARRATELLARVDVVPAGVIVNRIPHKGDSFYYGYGYGYDYSYGHATTERGRLPQARPTIPADPAKAQRFLESIGKAGAAPNGNGHATSRENPNARSSGGPASKPPESG